MFVDYRPTPSNKGFFNLYPADSEARLVILNQRYMLAIINPIFVCFCGNINDLYRYVYSLYFCNLI